MDSRQLTPDEVESARRRVRAGFMRDNRSVVMRGWHPQLREPREDVRAAWDDAAARAIETMQNVGWIAGGIDQGVANTVGIGLRLDARPDPDLFPDRAAAKAWSKMVEERFQLWANNPYECDIEARRKFGQQQGVALRSYFATGEITAEFPWRVRPGAMYGTKTRIVSPMRMSRRSDTLNRIYSGVKMDADGMPVGYLFKVEQPPMEREVMRRARDGVGRPLVLHTFDGMPGQVRGITPLVPALGIARQYDQLANATLMQCLINAVFAGTITSEDVTEEAVRGLLGPQEQARMAQEGLSSYDVWFEAQAGWYDRTQIDVGMAGRIVHMFPGQELKLHTSQAPAASYKDFALFLLREIARAIGITYESMTGDYAGVTFSSVRFATDEIWRIVMSRREFIVSPFCQAGYEAWLEEEIDFGRVEFPGGIDAFIMNRAAACNAAWLGSPKPQADEGAAARADETLYRIGAKSLSRISEDRGYSYEDVADELAGEAEMRRDRSLPEPQPSGVAKSTKQVKQNA